MHAIQLLWNLCVHECYMNVANFCLADIFGALQLLLVRIYICPESTKYIWQAHKAYSGQDSETTTILNTALHT